MHPLRQAMLEAMQVRGFAARTQASYLSAVQQLAGHYGRSPARLSDKEIQAYFLHLVRDRHLAPASCRLYLNGIVFLFRQVLHRELRAAIELPKLPQRIPQLLTRKEVAAIVAAAPPGKHRMALMLAYACGLRLNELVHLKVGDIDGERKLLHVRQGKGAKDRLVELPEQLLLALRAYWRAQRPVQWLFPGRNPQEPMRDGTLGKVFSAAKRRAGVTKTGGIHSLRHAYATHQLAAGMPLVKLQAQLGHRDIQTTLRYLHWLPCAQGGGKAADLLAELEVDHAH